MISTVGARRVPLLLLPALLAVSSAQTPRLDHFERKIRPVIVEQCEACHSTALDEPMGGLRLDSRDALRQGGQSGPAVVPGQPGQSLLLKALSYKDANLKMPPTGKLPEKVIADFRQWIADGALDPRTTRPAAAASSETKEDGPGTPIEEGRKWWAFQPLRQRPAPPASNPDWTERKIDSFILAKLDENDLQPSPPADPPHAHSPRLFRPHRTPAHLRPGRGLRSRSVTRRLCRPHRTPCSTRPATASAGDGTGSMSRAGPKTTPTSESTNRPHPYAWRYRDWVIEAFNRDIPYDRFIRMQFAADLLPGFEPADMRALGYIGNSPMYHKDPRLSRDVIETLASDDWDERVDAVSRGLMGLTVACARCHDHKFDPITNNDYYALAGVFASTWLVKRPIVAMDPAEADKLVWDHERLYRIKGMVGNLKELDTIAPELHPRVRAMTEEVKKLETELARDATPLTHAGRRLRRLDRRFDAHGHLDRPASRPTARPAHLHSRQRRQHRRHRSAPFFDSVVEGRAPSPSAKVRAGWNSPTRSSTTPRRSPPASGSTASGDGISASTSSARRPTSALRGSGPPTPCFSTTSPRASFKTDGRSSGSTARSCSRPPIARRAATSKPPPKPTPPTAGSGAMPPRRLDIESWRDAVLQVSGELNLAMGGPSEPVDTECEARRTVYSEISRGRPHAIFQLYDYPDATQHTPQRQITTTPLQQLFVLNSAWFNYQANSLAQRVYHIKNAREKIRALYQYTLLRNPTAQELGQAITFLQSREATLGYPPWPEYTQALLSTNEFIHLR